MGESLFFGVSHTAQDRCDKDHRTTNGVRAAPTRGGTARTSRSAQDDGQTSVTAGSTDVVASRRYQCAESFQVRSRVS